MQFSVKAFISKFPFLQLEISLDLVCSIAEGRYIILIDLRYTVQF